MWEVTLQALDEDLLRPQAAMETFFFLGKCLIFVRSPPLCDNVMQVEGGEGVMGKQRD